ncbi:MAG: TilS substrate C-terminal domain-containing protein [Methylohalobius sp.]
MRARLPLIYLGGELAAVADLWICEPFAAKPDEIGVTLHWKLGGL